MNDTPLSLLERLRQEPDEASWRRLVDLYTPLVRQWLRSQGVTDADADDLVQEVLGVLVREIAGFEHSRQRGAFRHWLRSVTLNRLRGYWRAKRRGQPGANGDKVPDLDEIADPDGELSRRWDREHDEHVARRLLELLEPEFAPPTWQAFKRQALDGSRPADVAAELGMSVNAVLIAKSRVMRRLRQEGDGLID
jgi:RNA polymerase sigma factor (sigma-70 family)